MAVTRLTILSREPLLEGKAFGSIGPYNVLRGTVACAVDPLLPQNQGITDLDKAPRTTAGQVEWRADVLLLQPAEMQRSPVLFTSSWKRGAHATDTVCPARSSARAKPTRGR